MLLGSDAASWAAMWRPSHWIVLQTMLVAVLGTHASASTWAFNALRKVLATPFPDTVSLFVERGQDLLENIPLGSKNVLIKCHSADKSLLELMAVSDAKVVVTDRNPCDVVASQIERFGLRPKDAVGELTKSFASIAMACELGQPLLLHYEDHFADDPETLKHLAQWLDLSPDGTHLPAIHHSLRADTLKRRLDDWSRALMPAGSTPSMAAGVYDHVTQLHPGHIGDGRVGKGKERLLPYEYAAVAECFPRWQQQNPWKTQAIRWSSWFFRFADGQERSDSDRLEISGEETLLAYGPYHYLPIGRWRAVPLISPEHATVPVVVKAEVYTERRKVLALRTVTIPTTDQGRLALEFDNVDHFDPIEFRLFSTGDGHKARIDFAGVELTWLGPCDRQPGSNARPVTLEGVLS